MEFLSIIRFLEVCDEFLFYLKVDNPSVAFPSLFAGAGLCIHGAVYERALSEVGLKKRLENERGRQ